ncbi:MAG TPA: hypothetical protein VHH34_08245 [Pseudonocardiaceae bacterium]|nr:hypothetical protein [Pseudonocardiaceae bacterium]
MDHHDVTGYYAYRSLLNAPEPVDDLNDIRFAEAELFLYVAPDGTISGTLAFPADPLAAQKEFMDLSGAVTDWSPLTVEFEGLGRADTGTAEFDYKYRASLAHAYPEADHQRPALVGTVIRAKPHGSAPAGVTASFIAVKRDFLPPKEIPGVALIPAAVKMLASRRHRLQHAVWHTVRTQWHALKNDANAVAEIDKRGWWPQRPPFRESRALDLENGAGEDFLYMHRKMILMMREVYAQADKSPPAGWTALPGSAVPQTVYQETDDAGEKKFVFDPEASGFMVPPPARDDATDRLLKSPTYLSGVMRPLEGLFRSPRLLSALTLGQLGNLLEFTIHGWMHIRWTYTTYDPETGDPIGRASLFDIDPKWDTPTNDDLGDFYSSHVHPTFWRLHGWIDDRINDWAAVNADRITPATVDDVPWFAADGHLVQVSEPFYWPSPEPDDHHQKPHHDHEMPPGEDPEVRVMEEVMSIMQGVLEPPAPAATAVAHPEPKTAKQAFRDVLLGADVPELPQ